jgi:adenosylmethionine-8-amino-7-oxononanoate aminotransferase
MADWCAPGHEPLFLTHGDGPWLFDARGRRYLDGNSSIWTNIHGHNHPALNAAIKEQLDRVAHTSFLGFTHPLAVRLADRLLAYFPEGTVSRVFFSDNGSTAIEVAIKMVIQYWQQTGHPRRNRFIAFENAYHGDTMGASSLGGVRLFHERFHAYQFPVDHVASIEALERVEAGMVAGVIIEPLIQGVNGMRPWPRGTLHALREWCDRTGVLLITDEVMTGFGRTGRMFACQHENVVPDLMAVAKGLTGGYMPMAATLVREKIFEAFLGRAQEGKTLYYGHSYTANQLGCAVALASLDVFEKERVLERLQPRIVHFHGLLRDLAKEPHVRDVRMLGCIAGVELGMPGGAAFPPDFLAGAKVCVAARAHGLLTRPIGDVVVLMPPLCCEEAELTFAVEALRKAIRDTLA